MKNGNGTASDAPPSRKALITNIRDSLGEHLDALGIRNVRDRVLTDKPSIRLAHMRQREALCARHRKALGRHARRLMLNFATADEVSPEEIDPQLVPVRSDDETGLLFRMATTLWSVPVSNGYGRRMRYLVVDSFNGKVIGIFALGDPVAGMAARDKWIGWTTEQRRFGLTNVLDAYVCGAVPPYGELLGGKLVASLIGSKEVGDWFRERYYGKPSEFSGQMRYPKLALVTITSALGRSSIYNRVRLPGLVELVRVGTSTAGWGHFHIPGTVFADMRALLSLDDHPYASGHRYGQGPNWRMRVIREALRICGLDEAIMRHGIPRELFAMPLADNWREYLVGDSKKCILSRPPANEIARAALARWVIPRAARRPEWKAWTADKRAAAFSELLEDQLSLPV